MNPNQRSTIRGASRSESLGCNRFVYEGRSAFAHPVNWRMLAVGIAMWIYSASAWAAKLAELARIEAVATTQSLQRRILWDNAAKL